MQFDTAELIYMSQMDPLILSGMGYTFKMHDCFFGLYSSMIVAQCHFMRSGLVLVLLTLFFCGVQLCFL